MAFYNNSNLQNITLSNNLLVIGTDCFSMSKNLTEF